MKIGVLGFDHGRFDKRIVAKDIGYLKKFADILYIYRTDINSLHQRNRLEAEDGVVFCGAEKNGQGWNSRKRYEDEIMKKALDFQPDFYYLHGMFLTFPVRRLKELKCRGKIVYDAHEYDPEPIALKNIVLQKSLEKILKVRDKIVSPYIDSAFTVSPSIRDYMLKAGYQKVMLKPNVSHLTPFKPIEFNKRQRRLIIAGGLQLERGPEKILNIISALINRLPEIRLHMYVNISMEFRDYIYKKIDHLDLQDNVLIEGLLPYEKLLVELSNSLGAFMSFPTGIWLTNYIALPNRFYDTLTAGTPVISSRASIDVSCLSRENCLGPVFDEDDFHASLNDLCDFLTNEKKYNYTLECVYGFAQEHTWDKISRVLDETFRVNGGEKFAYQRD